MASKKPSENKDAHLPLSALSLLAPPLRLVSAAMWKVMKERDVMHYGTLEEFVTSSCESVPGLLTFRHQAKLALGLRGRLILELCRGNDPLDPKAILSQLDRIRAPVPSSAILKRDIKVETTVSNFRDFVHTLLRDPVERAHFNKELPVEYGPQFDLDLEKLLWEFLIRLDSRFPVPNLAQTVAWLSAAPAVLEECAHAPSQPQLLRTLLQHQNCLGHIESAASLPPRMGDSILDSLSLPPSGRVAESNPSSACTPSCKRAPPEAGRRQPTSNLPFIEPVIGLMSNEDVPIMASVRRRAGSMPVVSRATEEEEEEEEATGSSKYTGVKQRSKGTSGVVVDQDVQTGIKRKLGGGGSESKENEEVTAIRKGRKRRSPMRTCTAAGLDALSFKLTEDTDLPSLVALCTQPRVVLHKLSLAEMSLARPTGPGDDIIVDSEDEATKNFKGRLFVKRYHKTKHDTYVPTLREFWKPGMARRDLLSPGNGHR